MKLWNHFFSSSSKRNSFDNSGMSDFLLTLKLDSYLLQSLENPFPASVSMCVQGFVLGPILNPEPHTHMLALTYTTSPQFASNCCLNLESPLGVVAHLRSPLLRSLKWKDHLSPWVQDPPGQQWGTPHLKKKNLNSQDTIFS